MDKTIKPHYLLILISTIKAASVLMLFLTIAVIFSPYKTATALNLIKMLIPIIVLIYAYVMFFWKSVTITLKETLLDFKMTAGRKNHFEILYNDIENVVLKQGILEKVLGVSRVLVSIKGVEKTYGDNVMVLGQYMVFKSDEALEIKNFIEKRMKMK